MLDGEYLSLKRGNHIMNKEIIRAYLDLLLSLKDSNAFTKLLAAKEEILKDEDLVLKLSSYHKEPNEEKKMALYCNNKFKKYKHLENEFNMLILELNKIFKELRIDKNACN
ncbi:MAG TPA: hypothetical protein IAB45_03235 [Candidatus Onthousia faecavium]|nr:hypothetical protein [Candidatus Onthousia faecavium]